MAELTPYPWQRLQWQRLQQQRARNLLPHALLLYGQPGLGLNHFARVLMQSLVCGSPGEDGVACGRCPACRQFMQGVYPDYQQVVPAEGKAAILVDQIRELNDFIALTQSAHGRKLALLTPADHMNVNAANSLLKTLEEPSGDTVIVLVAHSLSRLPATIRSRCQLVKFGKPPREVARDWLASRGCEQIDHLLHLAGGAPCLAARMNDPALLASYHDTVTALLEALESRRTVIELRQIAGEVEPVRLVQWVQSVLRDLQRASHRLPDAGFENSDHIPLLRRLAGLLDSSAVFEVSDRVVRLAAIVEHPLNTDLYLDDLLQNWMRLAVSQ